jgi:ATP-dependent helicase HepA
LRNTSVIQQAIHIAIGDFVRVVNRDLGIGKLASIEHGIAHVTWFHSPAQPVAHEEDVPVDSIERVELGNQHRVYHQDSDSGTWRAGRVEDAGRISGRHFGVNGDLYFIAFPNGDTRRVLISELETRWDRPLDNPTAILATRTTVTPFWHEGRALLMRSAMAQRAACGGLAGLFSASVDLKAHQVRIVRTVLNDPIPRYLLADEVGLGKTIEALAVLRQLVLEHPRDHATLIVAPPHLQDQWREELSSRFGLGPLLGTSIRILSLPQLASENAPRLLIVDEAHHPASYAGATSPEARTLYRDLARLAHEAPRLLLLSATPVLRNEEGFLAMLHLLDPAAYPLEERDAFRERISQRQQIAEWLGDLQDDASPLFMEDALNGISEQFVKDTRLMELAEAARPLVDQEEGNTARMETLAALRAYVGEVYRLHRRLLRTRRGSLADPLWGRVGAQVVRCEDSTRADAERLLLDWRGELMLAVYRQEAPRGIALALWRHFLDAVLSHPIMLRELASARLDRRTPAPDLVTCPLETLHAGLLFEGEEKRLRELVELLEDYHSTRDAALIKHLVAHPDDRFVVYVDRPVIARQLHGVLAKALGGAVRLHRDHKDVVAFTRSDAVRVLVCDGSAEEGLNLHHSPATIVHYDLPLAPNRIEQRLGRLDRIGAKRPVSSLVFDDGAPMATAWLTLLRSTIGVFDSSIASLQYVLDDHLQTFMESSFDEGVDAFEAFTGALRDDANGLEAEMERIRRQESLDALEADPREQGRFEEMEDFDLDDDRLQEELEFWLVKRLHFKCEETDRHGWRRRYIYRREGHHRTLVPFEHWLHWFKGMVAGAQDASISFIATPELTYRRRQAHLHLLPLVRIGHPLFDGAVAHAKHDDRGAAFAMWRWRPAYRGVPPVLAFRFDFVVEATPREVQARVQSHGEISVHALQRRLDALLPPRFLTIWLNDEFEEITAPDTVVALEEPYTEKPMGGGRDWNLVGERWAAVDARYPLANWKALVETVAAQATRRACQDPSLTEGSRGARLELATMAAKVTAQLMARLDRLKGAAREAERAHLDRERMLFAGMDAALEHPLVRLDSVGAIFLAGESPFDGRNP